MQVKNENIPLPVAACRSKGTLLLKEYMTQNVRFMTKRFRFIKLTCPGEPRLAVNLFLTGLGCVRSNSNSHLSDSVFNIKWSKTGVLKKTCYAYILLPTVCQLKIH